LFGIPSSKDAEGSEAWAEEGIVQQAVRALKKSVPKLFVITDVCLCEYTDHGHCGRIEGGEVLNDPTLALLARAAVAQARAGSDMVAPSDMMDGRVAAIRRTLDENGLAGTPILSYAVKYASAFYGPFREAAGSAPQFGDRKAYQMDPANAREALKEAALDVEEGADMIMVKPALPCLDILHRVRESVPLPVAAYQVSGEYAMIEAASQRGWIDREKIMMESLTAIRRAGADLVLTYYAKEAARILKKG
jgi:porphobilinogen synthase